MPNDWTVGDDYSGRCPSCSQTMNIGTITKAGKLSPGHVDACNRCGAFFEVVKIDLIPVVWFRKKEHNEAS